MAILDSHRQEKLPGFASDLWGYPIRTSSDECIRHINSHYLEVLSYGANQKIIYKAVEEDNSCVLSLALSAVHSYKSSSADGAVQLAQAKSYLINATSYERMVIDAAEALIEGQREAAITAYSKLLEAFPKDLVSLKRVQVLCFYRGKSEESLRLAQKVLPANKDSPYMYGMLAFSLLETGHFDEAEAAAKKALCIESADQWAQHALCHVYHYRCFFHEAIIFMERHKQSWNDCCSFMYSHNWWHLALLYMEWGSSHALDKVVEIFDSHIWPARCRDQGGSVQVSLNALGLLLRLELRGYGDGIRTRISEVAAHLCDQLLWHKERLLDGLAIWALAYAGELRTSQQLLKQIQERVHSMDPNEQRNLEAFSKLAESMYEYGKGNPEAAFNVLGDSFNTVQLKVIGASDEQLDVFEEMMCIAALRSSRFQQVSEVLQRRVATYHGSPFVWELMGEFYTKTGMLEKAEKAAKHADTIKQHYLQAIPSIRAQLAL